MTTDRPWQNPDYREGSDPNASQWAKRRFGAARRAVMRAMIGNGAGAEELRRADDWDVIGLPLGGRIKVTGSQHPMAQLRILRWVKTHEERRHWGASAFYNRWPGSGLSVQLTLQDFALIVGTLARREQEIEMLRRKQDDAASGDTPGKAGS